MPAMSSPVRTGHTIPGYMISIAGIDYGIHDNGCPVLDKSLGWVTCDAEQFVPAGDHTIVIGLGQLKTHLEVVGG